MRKIAAAVILLLLAAGFTAAQYADQYGRPGIRLMMKVDSYTDGSRSVQHFVLDPETGAPIPLTAAEAAIFGLDAVQLQQAVLTRSWHWDWPLTIVFNNTPDAKPKKKFVKKIINKFNNQRRGNNNTPKMKITTKVIQVKPLSSFLNPMDFYIQFNWDDHNTVIMTQDDQFFEDPQGNLRDPEIYSTTVIFAFATITQDGNRFVGTYYIVEADVYLRSAFFGLPKIQYQRLGTAAFRMTLGYQPTCWSHDYLSNRGHHVSNSAFTNAGSGVWTQISHVRDDFYYADKLGVNFKRGYLSSPRLLPFEEEVIDIGDYDLPQVDEEGNVDMSKTPILFLTNLTGLDTKKTRMIVKIFRVTEDDPPKEVRIVTLKGNTMRYPQPVAGFTQKLYASIFLNHVRIGREKDLKKLKNAVDTHGTQRFLEGEEFAKAIKIRVVLSGFIEEGGPKKTIKRYFWLVNTAD
jgi:hypothetical protein